MRRAAKVVRPADVAAVRELRQEFDRVFDAPSESGAARLLNELAANYATPPQLERVAGGWRLRTWPDEAEGLAAVAAFATAGLLEGFRDLGWQRFGRCDASPCRCAYVDWSKNRTRRYCSGLCADRVAQAQYRARKKTRPAR